MEITIHNILALILFGWEEQPTQQSLPIQEVSPVNYYEPSVDLYSENMFDCPF